MSWLELQLHLFSTLQLTPQGGRLLTTSMLSDMLSSKRSHYMTEILLEKLRVESVSEVRVFLFRTFLSANISSISRCSERDFYKLGWLHGNCVHTWIRHGSKFLGNVFCQRLHLRYGVAWTTLLLSRANFRSAVPDRRIDHLHSCFEYF